MRVPWGTPVFLVGFVLGLATALLLQDPLGRDIWDLVPALLMSSVAISVGWWINTTLKKKEQLHRIPIDYVGAISLRSTELIRECLDQSHTADKRLLFLARLSNEIRGLRDVASAWDPTLESTSTSLGTHFFAFKRQLTDIRSMTHASRVGHTLRLAVLKLQMTLSARILEGRVPESELMH